MTDASTALAGGRPAGQVAVEISDVVFAKIAAYETVRTPGVARLHPFALQAARTVLTSAAKRAGATLSGADRPSTDADEPGTAAPTADPAAVDVDREHGGVAITVRIVASTRPPIVQVVGEISTRVTARLAELTGITPNVIVNVLDIDPS